MAELTTSADEIYTVAKKVHDFVVRKMREEPSGDADEPLDLVRHDVS